MKSLKVFLLALAFSFVAAGAMAASFDFNGAFSLTDTDNNGFSETLSLNEFSLSGFPILNGRTLIQAGTSDPFLDTGAYITFDGVFRLDQALSSPGLYNFEQADYVDAFNIHNSAGTVVFEADLALNPLAVTGVNGSVNSFLKVNLTNIDLSLAPGISPLLDVLADKGAGITFTINAAPNQLDTVINEGINQSGSFSGSVANPVPEPGTLVLLGFGLLGMVGVCRKKIKK